MEPIETLQSIESLNNIINKEVDTIGNQLEVFTENYGLIRAEFRTSFDRLASMGYLKSGDFDPEKIQSSSIKVKSHQINNNLFVIQPDAALLHRM